MSRPGLRINKDFNDGDHTQQHERGLPRQQAENEQNRRRQFNRGGQISGRFRRQERNFIFVGKQGDGGVPIGQLRHRRTPEYGSDSKTQRDGQDGIGKTRHTAHPRSKSESHEPADRATDRISRASIVHCMFLKDVMGGCDRRRHERQVQRRQIGLRPSDPPAPPKHRSRATRQARPRWGRRRTAARQIAMPALRDY